MSSSSSSLLNHLPPEILLYIFSYLPAHECVSSVSIVCKLFNRLLKEKTWWKARKKSIGIVLDRREEEKESFSLEKIICRGEIESARWSLLPKQKMYSMTAHFGTVNAVRLYSDVNGGKRCISAGRDRTIRLWDIDRLMADNGGPPLPSCSSSHCSSIHKSDEIDDTDDMIIHLSSTDLLNKSDRKELLYSVDLAHAGWIWQVTRPNSSRICYTSGWDCIVKRWNITPSCLRESGRLNLSSAVVGLDWIDGSENELVCSTFLRRVCLIDVRDSEMKSIAEHNEHRNAVIGVASKGDYVCSWGEDRLIVMCDKRKMDTPIAQTKLPRSYVSQLSIGPTSITAGSAKGECFYLDPVSLESWGSFVANPKAEAVRGIVNTGYSIVTLSKLGKINAFSYGLNPQPLMTSHDFAVEPSRMDHINGDIIVAVGDGRLVFWPKPNKGEIQSLQ